ncbi:MAG TPA: PQQ-dependent sugar dehydrogenase, partial [Candidatus Marinimicrobia bacterium]|nr:PQQ-dependent sugar dehydrogenase [Candidatus Neomarinimicrobiota bacterium]
MIKKKPLIIWILVILFGIAALIRVTGRIYPGIKPSLKSENTSEYLEEFPKTNEDLKNTRLNILEDYDIGIYAENLGNPRVMVFDNNERLIVTDTKGGNVYKVEDLNKDGFSETNTILLENLNNPHGLVIHDDNLYLAVVDAVYRYKYDVEVGTVGEPLKILDLPDTSTKRHKTRFLAIGSDNKLYVSIGSSCDTCIERDERIATIMYVNLDGTEEKIFASGLRNAVYFSFHPETQELYATEMGRDHLGDNLPPDEINIVKEGGGYGWPFCYGNKVYDKVFAGVNNCALSVGSFIDLPAHVAPSGIAFAPKSFNDTTNDMFVALHGSWNSSVPVGYKVIRFKYENGTYKNNPEDFITGFLKDRTAVGRPAGLMFGKDNSLYISD